MSTQPSIQSPLLESFPSISTTTLTNVSQVIPSFLQLSSNSLRPKRKEPILPPIDLSKLSLTTSPTVTEEKRTPIDIAKPLADSSLARILKAAKAKRSDHQPMLTSTRKQTIPPSNGAVLGKVTSHTTRPISQRFISKSKYLVPKSVSCGNNVEKKTSDLSLQKSSMQKSMRRKLPMDRLVTVMKSRHKSDMSASEARFRKSKPSTRTIKQLDRRPSLPLSSAFKPRNSLSVDSLSLLQSNKKLTRVNKPRNYKTKRKEISVSTCKGMYKY